MYMTFFESEDKNNLLIDKVINILEKPYFKTLDNIGVDDKELIKNIFGKLYNDGVEIEYDDGGYNVYDSKGRTLYYEDPNGYWAKREYDENGNVLYYEHSSGFWVKSEYDDYGNEIYYEDSDGRWTKSEYDDYGNRIYYENSKGYIIDDRNNSINESNERENLFIERLIEILDTPYFKSLDSLGVTDTLLKEKIFSRLFNQQVTLKGDTVFNEYGKDLYWEDSNGYWVKRELDSNNNPIYVENSNGSWVKAEYDGSGNLVYSINNSGYWERMSYDDFGNVIYYEDSYGVIDDKRNNNINESYDSNFIDRILDILEEPYFKTLDSMGIDDKELIKNILGKLYNDNVEIVYHEDYVVLYNSNGVIIYFEDSKGFWRKWD